MDATRKHSRSFDVKGDEQETRSRILAAARGLMSTRGYKGATTKLISEAAGVNEVTIFRHFGNKEGILNAIMDESSAVGPYLEKTIQGEFSSLKEMLLKYGRTFYNLLVDQKEIFLIYLMEANCRPDMQTSFSRIPYTAVMVLTEKLQGLHERGIIAKVDFSVAAQMFVSTFFYAFMLIHHVGYKGFDITEEQLCESAAKILLDGVKNPVI